LEGLTSALSLAISCVLDKNCKFANRKTASFEASAADFAATNSTHPHGVQSRITISKFTVTGCHPGRREEIKEWSNGVQRNIKPGEMDSRPMRPSQHTPEDRTQESTTCRAELIFYAQSRATNSRPVKVLDEYTCDCRRADWEHRWAEWQAHKNPYLHLFLCIDHARKLGLME
jgi:hypothetical protein